VCFDVVFDICGWNNWNIVVITILFSRCSVSSTLGIFLPVTLVQAS
jgi:general stress protein CsbA